MLVLPIVLSLIALIVSVAALLGVRDINRRLRTVSLNSYVEQTIVSNNYIVNEGEGEAGEYEEPRAAGTTYYGVADTTDQGATDHVKVYLTFDDGPSSNTGRILDILKKHNVKATFFVNGTASEYPALEPMYKRIADEGHALGMHSYSHRYSEIYASSEAFEADLDKIHSLIYNETGVDTNLYRFPGGSGNTVSRQPMEVFAKALHDRGYEYYDWNIYPGDKSGRAYPRDAIVSGIMSHISEYRSAVILLHDSDTHDSTVDALTEVIEGLLARDAEFCLMDENTPVIQQVSY